MARASKPIPPQNRRVLAIFLVGLLLVVLGYVAWDVWLVATQPEGTTISWSLALLGRYPIAVFALGHITGGVLWGIVAHAWAGMIPPDQWDELQFLRRAVKAQEDVIREQMQRIAQFRKEAELLSR